MDVADITLPLWLVVSQWTLLFALGFLVIIMYRQVGYVQQIKDQGSDREGLSIGESAAAFDYMSVNGSINGSSRFEPKGMWTLLVFADPGCVSCEHTLLALERLAPRLRQTMRVMVATNAELGPIMAVDAFRTTSIEIGRIRRDVSSKLYHTSVTPFAFLIDPDGMIRAKGIVADESSIQKLVRNGARNPIDVEFIVS